MQQPELRAETAVFPLNANHFLPNQLNELRLNLPDAYPFSYKDPSQLSLAIESITFTQR